MIIQHMKSDPNALSHAYWGRFACGVALCVCIVTGQAWWVTLVAALVSPFLAGVGIEVIQRFQGGKNSLLESLLDVMQTGLFYITFWVNRRV